MIKDGIINPDIMSEEQKKKILDECDFDVNDTMMNTGTYNAVITDAAEKMLK